MKWKLPLAATLLSAIAVSGCGKAANEATPADDSPISSRAANVEQQTVGEVVQSSLLSDSDLSLGEPSAVAKDGNDQPADVLEEAHEVIERFGDDSVKRRWFVRLDVTFDRSKPWHEQAPGSWVQHGDYEEFYPGGEQLLVKGSFHEGSRDGEWTYWHPNGQVAKTGRYEDAQLTGTWQHYREDGTLLRTEEYANHQKHGTWRYYADDGQRVIREETYD